MVKWQSGEVVGTPFPFPHLRIAKGIPDVTDTNEICEKEVFYG
jgi:hypothetical protein